MPNYSAPTHTPFQRKLRHGMQGPDVKLLQQWLDTLNSYYQFEKNKTLSNTGFYGDQTKKFVASFQWFVGLTPPDGYYDFRTYDMIKARYNNMTQSMGF